MFKDEVAHMYLIQWKDHDETENTWQPMEDCVEYVLRFRLQV